MPRKTDTGHLAIDWLLDRSVRGVIATMLFLPYRWRVPAMGWITARILAPLAGYNRRSAKNLTFIYPDMPARQRRKIVAGVTNNMGRTFIEKYSVSEFAEILKGTKLSGDGVAALEEAKLNGRPVILVSGHFGNYHAVGFVLSQKNHDIGVLYRPAANKFFNRHYEDALRSVGNKIFPRGPHGTRGFVRHLVKGGTLALLSDQHVQNGTSLPFLGKPASTSLSAARLALRFDAALVPVYATRQKDGLHFVITVEQPIPHTDPETMTRAVMSSLEAQIEARPEQWLWVHRRWKTRRKKT